MTHPIESRVRAVGRQARRLMCVTGVACTVGTLLAAAWLAGGADYLIRFEDRGIRTICSALVALATAAAGVWYFRRRWAGRPDDVQVALRIEQWFPAVRDRLAAALEFLRQDEQNALAGSPALRRAVIAETTAAIEPLALGDALESRPAWRALGFLAGVGAVVGATALWNPNAVRTAVVRLAAPWNSVSWPREHALALVEPATRLALHQPLEVWVRAEEGSRLPEEVQLHLVYELEGRAAGEETVPMQFVDGRMRARLDRVTRSFRYFAAGGDGRTETVRLAVVEPPLTTALRVTLHPPAYTGWTSVDSEERIRALEGTRIEWSGQSDKSLRGAELMFQRGSDEPQRFPCEIAADGLGFALSAAGSKPFVAEKSGAYWFVLEDAEGFAGGGDVRYDLRVDADLPPTAEIVQPNANVFVTARARLPLKLRAEDDLGLARLELWALRSDQSEQGDSLVQQWPIAAARQAPAQGAAVAGGTADRQSVDHVWDLAPLALPPGTQLTFHAVARDEKPQAGKSPPRKLTIITPEELEERLMQRQGFILNELTRALRMEQESRTHTASLELQLAKVGRLEKPDIDSLQAADLAQRQVDRTLTSPAEGVAGQVKELLEELGNNQVDSPDIERQMRALSSELGRLAGDPLPQIGRELTSALKRAQTLLEEPGKKAADPALAESLAAAGRQQQTVIESLEKLLGELAQFDRFRRFQADVARVKRDHEDLAQQTAAAGQPTLGKELEDLSPQQQADLAKLGARQQDLARRFDQVRERLGQLGRELAGSDPLASGALSDAVEHAGRQAIAGAMRAAAQQVERNQVGQAAAVQQQVAQHLTEMLDILSNRREHELSRLVSRLKDAEREVTNLRAEQERLRKQKPPARQQPDEAQRRQELERLARRQRELAREAERLARLVRRLQADAAGRSLEQAAQGLEQAADGAGPQGERADESDRLAEEQLERAQRELARQRQQAELDLALEQFAKLQDAIQSIHGRQQNVLDETRRLEEARTRQGDLTRAQSQTARDLARQQDFLGGEVRELGKKLAGAAIVKLALDRTTERMQEATERLDRRETGDETQRAEADALRRLAQLLEAIAPEKPDANTPSPSPGEDEPGNQEQKPPADGVSGLAQLKLLKLMQEQVNQRTLELETRLGARQALAPGERKEYAALAEEQSQLADLTQQLLRRAAEPPPEDRPEDLPDLRERPDLRKRPDLRERPDLPNGPKPAEPKQPAKPLGDDPLDDPALDDLFRKEKP